MLWTHSKNISFKLANDLKSRNKITDQLSQGFIGGNQDSCSVP